MSGRLAWLALAAICLAAAPWTPPPDGVLTESQLQSYISATRDWQIQNSQIADALAGATTDAERSAVLAGLTSKRQACLDRCHLSEAEYTWIARRATDAWTVAADNVVPYDTQIADRDAQCNIQIKLAQARKATYEEALKDCRRVLSPEDRAAAIRTAQSDEKSYLEESRQRDEEALIAAREAVRDDAHAKAADAQANGPPPDISAEYRSDFMKQMRLAAQVNRDAAAAARARTIVVGEGRDTAIAKAALAAQIAFDPTVPLTDEDKAAVCSDDRSAIAEAQCEIEECTQDLRRDAEVRSEMRQAAQKLQDSIPPQNIELMQMHYKEFVDLFSPSVQP